MKVLHLLRDPGDPKAAAVIGAEVAQGVEVGLLLLGPGAPPRVNAPVYRLVDPEGPGAAGATPVDWSGAVDLIFQAGSVVAW
jgi:hypothetical protein